MLDRFGDADQPDIADRTAKTCLLVPDAVPDLDRVMKLADRAVNGTENHPYYRYFVFVKALAEYRADRNAEAVKWLERFAPHAGGANVDAAAFAVLAMAQHRLGQIEAGRAALDSAAKIVGEQMPDPIAGRSFGNDWDDWLRCLVLFREAHGLLKKEFGVKSQGSGKKPN